MWSGLVVNVCLFVAFGCDDGVDVSSLPPVTPAVPRVVAEHQFVGSIKKGSDFHESPQLTARVHAGDLPPVEERVSDEPLVVNTLEMVGAYGGTWRRAFTGPTDRQNADRLMHDHVLYFDMDGHTIVPHIARDWQISEDGKVFTIYLRRNMRWSDGHPFTADDFMYAYEAVFEYPGLSNSRPSWLMTSQGPGRYVKIDDYTLRIVFPMSNHGFLELLAGSTIGGQFCRTYVNQAPYQPAHYLRQFHPKHIGEEKANALAMAEGYDNWPSFYLSRAEPHRNPGVPVVSPWKVVSPITKTQFVLERNPYYWVVDSEGNQLPYIDRIEMYLTQDPEVLNLRAISGLIDMQHRHIELAKVPLLHHSKEKGNYRILLWPARGGMDCGVYVNQTYDDDPAIAQALRSLAFRQALSLAIDRSEINELIFMGTGKPRSFVPPEDTPFYPGEVYETNFVKRDIDAANQLLDQSGWSEKDAEGYRLRRDGGGRLTITLSVRSAFLDFPGVAELLVRHWAEIGLQVYIGIEEDSLFAERNRGNQQQMTIWSASGSENPWIYPYAVVPYRQDCKWAPATGRWYETDGTAGAPPNEHMKRLMDLYEGGKALPLEKRILLGQEMFRIHTEQLYVIGIVGLSPAFNGVVVVKNNMRNVPTVAPNSPAVQNPGIARPETFFFER